VPPISERPIPPVPPEQRPERLLTIDTKGFSADGVYVNAAYEWLHAVAERRKEPDAVVEAVGSYYLVLLQAPMRVSCITTGWTFRMMAGILHVNAEHQVNGWMMTDHQEAREVFKQLLHPDAIGAPEDEPGTDFDHGTEFQPDPTEEDE
jgi:hypothetical protein